MEFRTPVVVLAIFAVLFLLAIPISAIYFTYGMVGIMAFPLLFAAYTFSILLIIVAAIIGLIITVNLTNYGTKARKAMTFVMNVCVAAISYETLLRMGTWALGLTGLVATWITTLMLGVAIVTTAVIIIVAIIASLNNE